VFLVTGARVKIGFHVVLKLLRCGATVLATSRFPADTAARYAAQPDASSWIGRLRIYGLDMRDLSSLELFCRHLIGTCHRLDGIVNNAGVGLATLVDAASTAEMLNINLRGPMRVSRAFLPLLKASGDGLIVNISSIAGFTGTGSNLGYVAAKAGVDVVGEFYGEEHSKPWWGVGTRWQATESLSVNAGFGMQSERPRIREWSVGFKFAF
jgi:NAD(P)-dependent dehydrogenase (short-subunit alcohol dehydrogenase family)